MKTNLFFSLSPLAHYGVVHLQLPLASKFTHKRREKKGFFFAKGGCVGRSGGLQSHFRPSQLSTAKEKLRKKGGKPA